MTSRAVSPRGTVASLLDDVRALIAALPEDTRVAVHRRLDAIAAEHAAEVRMRELFMDTSTMPNDPPRASLTPSKAAIDAAKAITRITPAEWARLDGAMRAIEWGEADHRIRLKLATIIAGRPVHGSASAAMLKP